MEEYVEKNYSLENHLDKITKLFSDFEETDNLTKKIKLRNDIHNELKKIKESMARCKDVLENDSNEDNSGDDEQHNYKKIIKAIEKIDELELISQILEYKKLEKKINSVKVDLMN